MLKKYFGFILIVFLGLIPLIPLLHPGLPVTHDGQDHVARIANFYLSLSEGNFVPRWAGSLNWGYGHPILMFLYPVSSYSASLVHLLGFSFVDSLKIVFGAAFVLSGIFMYLWIKEFLDEGSAIAGSVLYMYAPYRFVDLYVRGAIGEHMAFVFPPLVLYFLLKMFQGKNVYRYLIGGALSFGGLILAHNAISLMFIPFIFVYALYLVYLSKKRFPIFVKFASVFVLGFGISAFFWIPAFIEGKYTLRDIVIGAGALKNFVKFDALIFGPWSYGQSGVFSVQVGILQWIGVLVSPLLIYRLARQKSKSLALYIILLLYFLGSLFIMLPVSSFIWTKISLLEKFQFPWRFLSISVFSAAVLFSLLTNSIPERFKKGFLFVVIISALILNINYAKARIYQQKPESFYSGIYNGTTDTGESAPIWSIRFMEHRPKAAAEVISGKAKIIQLSRKTTDHKYSINSDGQSKIRENTLYFPGWTVYIDGVKDTAIQFQDPNSRGLITYFVPSGKHNVEIKFENTKLRTLSDIISALCLLVLLVIFFGRNKLKI